MAEFADLKCHNVTCAECMPQDESCAFRCQQKCTCACLGYEIDGTDLGLYLECGTKRDCFAKYFPAVLVCPDEECLAKRLLDMETCKCECLQLTRAQASVAVAITAATICGETMRENNGQCKIECEEGARQILMDECGGEGEKCLKLKKQDCRCHCAGLPSTTPPHDPAEKLCDAMCYKATYNCMRGVGNIEQGKLCSAYKANCLCECRAGAAKSTDAAEYRTATEDRAQLELCAYVRSCHNATCGCLEGDEECVSQCRDSCRCGCLSFPGDGPGAQRAQPAGGRLTVSQCRDRREACVGSCAGDRGCKDWCYLEKEVCDCQCAGRSIPPSPKKRVTIPTDTGDKPTVMHCNYLN
ncbi:balbiani ring protein 3-like isoform X2 [Frankliniella occidentalis]|uniref:Balbiani ring protein 3-like isoform X2 n=1 Tax=Frankliniella occidentalis TaxID=133901 RepID=A0A9C6X0Y1_FRAOC|nr:balbiani ring protein 3-like isoform X2 [Frankliniella occidentalis]